jgi:hypothetical protein
VAADVRRLKLIWLSRGSVIEHEKSVGEKTLALLVPPKPLGEGGTPAPAERGVSRRMNVLSEYEMGI